MHEDSRGRFDVSVDKSNSEIVLRFLSKGPTFCYYSLKFEDSGGLNSLIVTEIPKVDISFLPSEEAAFASEVEMCSAPELVGNQSGSTLAYFSEFGVWLDQGSYIGCEADARFQTTGLIVQIGSTRFRIVQTMRRLTVTRLEAI